MTKLADEILITPTLLRRFELEASEDDGDGRFYALIRRADGNLLSHHLFGPQLDPQQMLWARDVLTLLNRELHHDGAWVICFTHPHRPEIANVLQAEPTHWDYDRWVLLWLDEDGDVQIPYDWMKGTSDLHDFVDVLLAGIEHVGQHAEAAWQVWHKLMRQVPEIKAGDERTFKRARGEKRPARQANG